MARTDPTEPVRSAQRIVDVLSAQGVQYAFTATLRRALAEEGPSLIDVPVDYSRNTDLAAQLHDDPFE
ncbi:hypothetical protein HMPREF0591_2137 [Mycobacterium parascrofulaceum ATCC BAA-614]|uniref:Acetolactate synthase n=1 Tax=Mycobacterium parascrofulaceum ATCC BAA-614 TaxID=525368 RepID=D5P7J3_9MYCO|nr:MULTISPECIES: hypothetical protein [Mycobacterium]EFG77921.1 hypothetical protein HMPREF0591_2137 [Mycobacterium parascrofulaceum ATCC BAA-614]OCB34335.1 hypothetical protein A9X02_22970 [Mycobacterium malmoense]